MEEATIVNGKKYLVKTPVYHYEGEVVSWDSKELVFGNISRVFDTRANVQIQNRILFPSKVVARELIISVELMKEEE